MSEAKTARKESGIRGELKQVRWPKGGDLFRRTMIVFGGIFALGAAIYGIDKLLVTALSLIT